jgi:hypothetical protein
MADLLVSQPLRITLDRQRADDWALALASAGIESRLDQGASGYTVVVREWRPPPTPCRRVRSRESPLLRRRCLHRRADVVRAIVGPSACASSSSPGRAAGRTGSSAAARSRRASPTRGSGTVTALTLHADFRHILTTPRRWCLRHQLVD